MSPVLLFLPRTCRRAIFSTSRLTWSVPRPFSSQSHQANSKVDLPPEDQWGKLFLNPAKVGHRVSLRNAATAAKLADAFVPRGSQGKVIIEAFPGPGQLTRALMNLPKKRIQRIIVLEDWEPYVEYLQSLSSVDPRVVVVNRDGYNWETYSLLKREGLLDDVLKTGWEEGVHPQLQFVSHLPSTVLGEQLISQLLRAVPDQEWLFHYGRIPLSFILSDYVYKRVTAGVDDLTSRCKVSIVAEAVAECKPALPFQAHQPYSSHFHPKGLVSKSDKRAVGQPFRSLNLVPLAKPYIEKGEMYSWDYCLRRLYVKKATQFRSALPSLAPGAQTLIKPLTDGSLPGSEKLDISKQINKLTASEWALVMRAFQDWPFKPLDLDITDTFSDRRR